MPQKMSLLNRNAPGASTAINNDGAIDWLRPYFNNIADGLAGDFADQSLADPMLGN